MFSLVIICYEGLLYNSSFGSTSIIKMIKYHSLEIITNQQTNSMKYIQDAVPFYN